MSFPHGPYVTLQEVKVLIAPVSNHAEEVAEDFEESISAESGFFLSREPLHAWSTKRSRFKQMSGEDETSKEDLIDDDDDHHKVLILIVN